MLRVMGGVAFLAAIAASAAEPAAGGPEPDPSADIIVTGERSPRKLQDTAASVAVFMPRQVERLPGADRLESLLPLIPNVQIGSGGEGPAIRGQDTTGVLRDLPAFLGGTRPRTTLQIDGRPADYFELVFGFTSLWDLAQAEIYRSPQTITHGRNAIAGAIFLRTADPTASWETKARAIAGSNGRVQLSAAASGPLGGDDLAFRLSADWGRQRPHSRIADRMIGASPDIDRQALARLKLRARLGPDWQLLSTVWHGEAQSPQIERITIPFRRRRDPLATYGVMGTWVDALTSELSFAPSDRFDASTIVTLSRTRWRRYAPEGLGEAQTRKSQATAEQILRWRPAPGLRLLVGAHLLGENSRQHIDISQLSGIGDFRDSQRSLGLFAEAEWSALPRLTLAAALRHQEDRQDRRGAIVGPAGTASLDYRGDFDALLPRLTISWAASDRFTLGAMVQKAYNPGGSTLLLNGVTDDFRAETLWDGELFARGRLDRGRLRWSANLFLQRFRATQRPQLQAIDVPGSPPVFITLLDNAPRARARGLEAEFDWSLGEQWRVAAALGLLDTKITRTRLPSDPLLGRRFQRAPRLSASLSVDWKPARPWTLSAQLRGHSGYYSDDSNSPERRIDGGAIADAKASYDLGKVRLSGFVRNLFDRFQLTYLYPGATAATAEDPREVGIELGARF